MKFVTRESIQRMIAKLGYSIKQSSGRVDLVDTSGKSVMKELGSYGYYGYAHPAQIIEDFPQSIVQRDGFVEDNIWVGEEETDWIMTHKNDVFLADETHIKSPLNSGYAVCNTLVLTRKDIEALQNGKAIGIKPDALKRLDRGVMFICFTEEKPEGE